MKRVTMAAIAEKAGLSKNTVSLALRNDPQIPTATRKRIERIASKLGYTKNPVVAQLMAELRKTQPAGYQRTIALINAAVIDGPRNKVMCWINFGCTSPDSMVNNSTGFYGPAVSAERLSLA